MRQEIFSTTTSDKLGQSLENVSEILWHCRTTVEFLKSLQAVEDKEGLEFPVLSHLERMLQEAGDMSQDNSSEYSALQFAGYKPTSPLREVSLAE